MFALAFLLVCLNRAEAELAVEPDKENVVASRLEGVWRPEAALTKRLTGREQPRGEGVRPGAIAFRADPEVVRKIPKKYEPFLGKRRIFMAGVMVRGDKPTPFVLIENSGNPHLVYFRERDGDPLGDAESFNLILAPAEDKQKDLLFIGGDFNNQPFYAYERVPEAG
jgi:hypothetical protein